MCRKLARWIKLRLFRSDYDRMARLASNGDYFSASIVALMLGEHELQRRYELMHRTQTTVARATRLARSLPARLAIEESIRTRRN